LLLFKKRPCWEEGRKKINITNDVADQSRRDVLIAMKYVVWKLIIVLFRSIPNRNPQKREVVSIDVRPARKPKKAG
jgi:hypothetical protein